MNCKRAKLQIALSVGSDLDKVRERELKRHLAKCPPCRNYRVKLKQSLQVLHEPRVVSQPSVKESIWPRLEGRLRARSANQSLSRFNGWIAGGAVAAACCVLVAYAVTYPSSQVDPHDPSAIWAQPAGEPIGENSESDVKDFPFHLDDGMIHSPEKYHERQHSPTKRPRRTVEGGMFDFPSLND